MKIKTEGGKGFDGLLSGMVLGPSGMRNVNTSYATLSSGIPWNIPRENTSDSWDIPRLYLCHRKYSGLAPAVQRLNNAIHRINSLSSG